MIIDADGLIMGRLASLVAKKLLEGEEVKIVNAESVVITGTKHKILQRYKEKRARTNKHHGPFFPRMPDRILKRTVRGMLPYKQYKGRKAFKRLRVYIGVPDKIEKDKIESYEQFHIKNSNARTYIRLGELSRLLGANFGEEG